MSTTSLENNDEHRQSKINVSQSSCQNDDENLREDQNAKKIERGTVSKNELQVKRDVIKKVGRTAIGMALRETWKN